MTDRATLSESADLVGGLGMLRNGSVSSAELVDRSLERIETTRETLNAFRCVRSDAARAEAARADERIAAGEEAPLLGVPVAIKDDSDLAGESTMFGCEGDWEPKAADGEVARRLKEAGAVIVGKTTTPELGQWPITEGPGFGKTRNPWNLDHTPGGSSGGSASAVAAGLVPAAVGSDGAGSIRIPASWTNLVGVKPQRGRVSTWPAPEAFNGLTCYGPLTRTVADAALLLDVISGNHEGDLHRPEPPAVPFAEAVRRGLDRRLRVGLSFRVPFSGPPAELDPRIRERVGELAGAVAELGHAVEEDDPAYGLIGIGFVPRGTAGVAEWVASLPGRDRLDERTVKAARTGRFLGGPILRAARLTEGLFARRIGSIFNEHDALIVPTTAQPPLPVGAIDGQSEWQTDKIMVGACPYTWPWNVLGWPGVSVPAGFVDGLPVGAQLLGPANSEGLLLALAAELEEKLRWSELTPPDPFT